MIKVLVISKILPISEIAHKKAENDILFITEDNLKERYPDIEFIYIYPIPYTPKFLTKVSSKWNSYSKLKKKKNVLLRTREIFILDLIQLPKKFIFRNVLYKFSVLFNKKNIDQIIEDYQPTVIHAHNVDVDAYLAKRISQEYNIPYIITLRELNFISDFNVVSNLNNANHLIALSPTQLRDGNKVVNKEITLIPHGISDAFFIEEKEKNSSGDCLRLVSVSLLIKRKNLDLLIRSLATVDFKFVLDIIGEGPEKENLQSLVEKLNIKESVNFRGLVPHIELPPALLNYDLFVLPSFPETLGRVYFEAMAAGLPVIASRGTGIDGFITEGKEGLLIDHRNPKSLVNKLEKLADNPEQLALMGRNAKNLAKKFSWEMISARLYDIYSNAPNPKKE